jgi:hypothetical protein
MLQGLSGRCGKFLTLPKLDLRSLGRYRENRFQLCYVKKGCNAVHTIRCITPIPHVHTSIQHIQFFVF